MYFKTFLKRTFLILLMAIFMPWAAKAQETLTVYDATDANQGIPMYGYYFDDYTKSECIIPADELTDMGGGTITAITFYAKTVATSNSTWGSANQKVFVKEVSGTTLGGSYSGMTDATVVFDGLLPMPTTSTDGYTITFSQGYIYNGGNLLIGVYNDDDGSYNKVEWYGKSGLTSGVSSYGSNGNSLASCGYSAQTFLPKTKFTYTPAGGVSCAKPKNFDAVGITAHTATLSWEAGDEESNWDVYVTTDSGIVPDDDTEPTYQVTTCSKALTELNAQTTYYAYVRANCGSDDSKWAKKIFSTTREALAVDATHPYEQNFETGNGWEFTNGTLTNQWCWGSATNNGGEKAMYVSNDNGVSNAYALNSTTTVFASKLFSFAEGTYTVSFDWKADGEKASSGTTQYDYMRVALVPGDVEFTAGTNLPSGVSYSALPSSWIALDGGHQLNMSADWQSQTAEAAVIGTYSMVFIWRNDSGGGNQPPAAIDNIGISFMTCPRPTGLQANGITGRTATLTWTENGTATNWVLQYATNSTFSENLEEVNVTGTASKALSGLTPETPYYARVKAVLGNDESSWSDVANFTTLATCPKPTLDYVSYSATAFTGSVSWTGSTADAFEVAYRPIGDFEPSDYSLTDVTRVQLENVTEYTYTLENLTPETKYYIYIQANCGDEDGLSSWSNRVIFTTTATCVAPSSLTDESVTSSSVNLSWTKGADDQNAWQFRYKKTSESEYTYVLVENHPENTYTLTGLEPATSYYVNVRAWCGGDDYSKWSLTNQTSDKTITTACAELMLPYTCDFEGAVETSGHYASYPVPKCWDRVEMQYGSYSPYTYYPYVYSQSSDAHGGTKSLRMYRTPNSANQTIIMPAIDDSYQLSDLQIRFWAKAGSSNNNLYVGVMEGSNFVQVATVEGISTTYAEFTVPLSDYTGTGRNIAIKCGSSTGYSYLYFNIDDVLVEVIPTCWVPTALAVKETSYNAVSLTWNAGKDETEWNIQYKKSSVGEWGSPIHVSSLPTNDNPYVLTGLKRGTDYDVRVRAYCDADDQSEWCNAISFTTDCGIWPIDNANALFEGFSEDAFPPACWDWIRVSNYYGWQHSTNVNDPVDPTGTAFSYWPSGDTYLILPHMHINGNANLTFDMAFSSSGSGEESSVVLSTTGCAAINFTNTLWTATDYPTTKTNVSVSLSDYDDQDVYIAFKFAGVGTDGRMWYVDNIQVYVADNVFTTEGEWNTSTNWSNGTPSSTQSVHIDAPVTIPGNATIEVANVTVGTGSITIAEGGQLRHNNEDVVATMQKSIAGYNRGGSNWYFIAHPMSEAVNVSTHTDLTVGTYDLYAFDESKDGEQWRNFKFADNNLTQLEVATGYLYANGTGGTFNVTGTLNPSSVDVVKPLAYTPEREFTGWNLVGNPFACNAYLKENQAFYRINENGDAIATTASTGAIAPMEGVFVKASAANQTVTFTSTAPASGKGNLNLNVAKVTTARDAQPVADNAIIRFDGGDALEKLCLSNNSTKVYIPMNGKDYAVVSTEGQGVIPVNFKANENGRYTFTISSPLTSQLSTLTLIDNLTGANVDLLATPSYTFEARDTDMVARFKLVFSGSNSGTDENFAFISDGQLIVSGTGTLNVYDALGRQVSVKQVTSLTSNLLPLTSGVYVLQLVNGNEVKTQKIIVK